MADIEESPEFAALREQSTDAAQAVFDRHLKLMAPPRHVIAEALAAAAAVVDRHEQAEIDRMMNETQLFGIDADGDGGVQLRLKLATDMAQSMVLAFDTMIQQGGCENYTETDFTVTDPAQRLAIEQGLPAEQWPPHRQYRFIVVKPGGKSPHDLRREAEQRIDAATRTLAGLDDDTASATSLEDAVDKTVAGYDKATVAHTLLVDEMARLVEQLMDRQETLEELRSIRAAGVDPGLLRWCSWPDCLASFDASRGPEGGGWKQYRHMAVLLCPRHAQTGHWPSFDMDRGDLTTFTARCGCGAAEKVQPSNWDAVYAWWGKHLDQAQAKP